MSHLKQVVGASPDDVLKALGLEDVARPEIPERVVSAPSPLLSFVLSPAQQAWLRYDELSSQELKEEYARDSEKKA